MSRDAQTGNLLTRRRLLAAIGGAAWFTKIRGAPAAQGDPGGACVVRPRHIEGPYFVDAAFNRSDIRSDPKTGIVKYGVPLRLTFRVSQVHNKTCLPLSRAQIDVWQ